MRKGETDGWKIAQQNSSRIIIDNKYASSRITLSLLKRVNKTPLMLAYTLNQQVGSFEIFEETDSVMRGTKVELPELEISNFFLAENKPKDISEWDRTYPDYYMDEQNRIRAYLSWGSELAEKADYAISLQWDGEKFNLMKTLILKYRFKVSFYSIGYGTESNAKKRLQQFIGQYEKKHRVKISFERSFWGKEGEVDYCFRLKGLNAQQQRLFVAEVKKLLKGSMTRIEEYAACQGR